MTNRDRTISLFIAVAYFAPQRSLRDRFSLWITPWYIRWLVRKGTAVLVVGRAGTGKTTLLKKTGLRIVERTEHSPTGISVPQFPDAAIARLPDGPLAFDEAPQYRKEDLTDALGQLRGRGFVLAVQELADLDGLGVVVELGRRPCIEVVYLDSGNDLARHDAFTWLGRRWPHVDGMSLQA